MKPKKLIISWFGPYAGTMPAIDFTEFDDKGIFLITGNTGAGKTMIFDAMVYALYGKTSGRFRDPERLRSDYATETDESYVDFYFSHQGKDYRIKRKPEQTIINKDGEIDNISEYVCLYMPDNKTVEGIEKVDGRKKGGRKKKITTEDNQIITVNAVAGENGEKEKESGKGAIWELLKIDADQFKQIALIAQGEFWELLNSKTNQRTDILRTIFETGKYDNLAKKLKEYQDNASTKCEVEKAGIIQYFKDVTVDPSSPESELFLKVQEQISHPKTALNIETMLESINQVIEADEKKCEDVTKQLAIVKEEYDRVYKEQAAATSNNKLVKRRDDLVKHKDELADRKAEMDEKRELLNRQKIATRDVKPLYNAWNEKQNEKKEAETSIRTIAGMLEEAKSALEKAKQEYELAIAKEPEADEKKKRIDRILQEQEDYKNRDELNRQAGSLEKKRGDLQKEEEELTEKENKLNVRKKELEDKIKELDAVPVTYAEESEKGKKLVQIRESIRSLRGERKTKLDKLCDEKDKACKKAEEKRVIYEETEKNREEAEQVLEKNRLVLIAMKLKDGDPCPVCGSTHHPQKAHLSEKQDSVSEEQVLQLKKDAEACRKEREKSNTDFETAKATYEENKNALIRDIRNVMNDPLVAGAGEIDSEDVGRWLDAKNGLKMQFR